MEETPKENVQQGKTNLNAFDNSWYKPGNPIKILLWYVVNACVFNSYCFPFQRCKRFMLRLFGAKLGKGVIFKPKVNIKYPWKLEIGNHVWIGEQVWIDNLAQVTIEDHVCLSQGAMLLCGNHNYRKSTFDLITGTITLKEGAWIGAKAVVCPGVTCHSHALLTVGSVAVSDLEEYAIYQGNPAKKIRERKINES